MLDNWTRRLAPAIAAAVREVVPSLRCIPVVLLAVDCHPWHGSLGLAALTAAEAEADSSLTNPAEMAAWQHYLFSDGLTSWQPTASLGIEMQTAFEAATDRAAVTDCFYRAVAQAMVQPEVVDAIELLEKTPMFRVSVAHPDNGREFFGC